MPTVLRPARRQGCRRPVWGALRQLWLASGQLSLCSSWSWRSSAWRRRSRPFRPEGAVRAAEAMCGPECPRHRSGRATGLGAGLRARWGGPSPSAQAAGEPRPQPSGPSALRRRAVFRSARVLARRDGAAPRRQRRPRRGGRRRASRAESRKGGAVQPRDDATARRAGLCPGSHAVPAEKALFVS